HQACGGAEERAAAGGRLRRDVRGRHEILGGCGEVALALVGLAEGVGGVGGVGPVGAAEEVGEDRAGLTPARVFGQQPRVAEDRRLAPLGHVAAANWLCGDRRGGWLYASYTTGHAPTGTAPAPTLSKTSSAASSAGNSSASRLENSRAPVQSFSSTAIPART